MQQHQQQRRQRLTAHQMRRGHNINAAAETMQRSVASKGTAMSRQQQLLQREMQPEQL